MAKKQSVYICQECGYESQRWIGQCICGAWNTMVEEKVVYASENDSRRRTAGTTGTRYQPKLLKNISSSNSDRIDVGISEVNRVLGGGLVVGSLTLISGEPGIGKSTILIQIANNIADNYGKVLYISGEESEEQIKLRADRICGNISDNLFILSETNLENVSQICKDIKPIFLIIDSIQTMYTQEIESAAGSVSQVRACGNLLMNIGKGMNIATFIVAHVTKSGELAGPKIVEHLVDTVLNFGGERNNQLRILRSFKNRFGTTNEIGAFKMEKEGLIEVSNISENFLESDGKAVEGSCISAVYEGSRPVLLELQALCTYSKQNFPKRTAVGIDSQRTLMLIAVLEKKTGVPLYNYDVYLNVVGGLKVESTYVDLAILLSVYSSKVGKSLPEYTVITGEVGLTGEVRYIQHCEKILLEAVRLGYKNIVIPYRNKAEIEKLLSEHKMCKDINIVWIKNVSEAISWAF